MEDSLSVKSNESIATSEEFDFITDKPGASKTPTLNLNKLDLNELQSALSEVIEESQQTNQLKTVKKMQYVDNNTNPKRIGQSVFYSGLVQPGDDPLSSNKTVELSPTLSSASRTSSSSSSSPQDEKGDVPKSEFYDCEEEVSDVDQDCTIFSGVAYLGAANINAPKSETEIQRNMAILNEQSSEQGIKVSVSVPLSSQGFVVLYDANTNTVIARYEVHRILFYARGGIDTAEAGCFAFTWSHGDTQESAIFQCHVFRCDISEAVTRVSACFSKAFQRVPRSISSSITSSIDMAGSVTTIPDARTLMYVFEVNLEIKEDDGKGVFSTVGRDKNGFRLKTNMEKQLCLSIKQVSDNGPQLTIERCFGVLIASGRHVKHSDMQLLEMKDQTPINNQSVEQNCTQISATWDPTDRTFDILNQETPKDYKQYMTIAVDLVIRGIQEPVRFQMETLVRIINSNERNFWYFQKKSLIQQFFLNLKEIFTEDLDIHYDVINIETLGELDRNLLNLNLKLPNLISSPSITSIDQQTTPTMTTTSTTKDDDYNSDGDEPLLSGTGLVSKDCSVDVLESWADVLNRWKQTKQPPKQLNSLVRLGIPEALRGEVWQRLVGVEENAETMETYRVLITKECSCENVIQRDIARTFPAHNFFKEAGGLGQDSLYRVSKAYAVYDSEIGYCQGLSFLAATLLLHMPEEQAFCVLVKLMYDYHLRDLYKDGFDNLYLRLYQLNRLMEEHLPALYQHFKAHHVETHMFASQWFLTLFTARFPLYFVFHIIDVFLLQGIDTLFQIALALLMFCKKDLLLLDFEGILKYFRVSLPKKCRTEEAAKQLVKLACNIKVKKLKKYESDFIALKDGWEIIKLDSEAADNVESESDELQQMRIALTKSEEERIMMIDRINQLRKEVDQAEAEKRNSQTIINDYKLVKQRLDTQLKIVKMELEHLKQKVSNCDKCNDILNETNSDLQLPQIQIKTDDNNDLERVRELELELAQTKLAHVEAECRNQDLIHQLRNAEYELQTAKNSWPPWLSKTLSSIKEVANKKDFTNFAGLQSTNSNNSGPSFVSHINAISRRESVPLDSSNVAKEQQQHQQLRRGDSLNVIKDSQSCTNLKTQQY